MKRAKLAKQKNKMQGFLPWSCAGVCLQPGYIFIQRACSSGARPRDRTLIGVEASRTATAHSSPTLASCAKRSSVQKSGSLVVRPPDFFSPFSLVFQYQ